MKTLKNLALKTLAYAWLIFLLVAAVLPLGLILVAVFLVLAVTTQALKLVRPNPEKCEPPFHWWADEAYLASYPMFGDQTGKK